MKSNWVSNGPCNTCNSSDAMSSYEDGSTYCHSCKTYSPPKTRIVDVKSKLYSKVSENKNTTICLPADASFRIEPIGYNWLTNYGLTHEDITRHKIQWSNNNKSLIFPIYQGNVLIMYQQRYFGSQFKWKTTGVKAITYSIGNGSPVVLVEDIVSAIKVGTVTTSIPLFGSSVNTSLLLRLSKLYNKCFIWLDRDKAKESIAFSSIGKMFMDCAPIITDKDPKCYDTDYIRSKCT